MYNIYVLYGQNDLKTMMRLWGEGINKKKKKENKIREGKTGLLFSDGRTFCLNVYTGCLVASFNQELKK